MQSEFSMPTVEFHIHLEDAAPPAPISQITHEKKDDINGIFDDQEHNVFRNFTHFLAAYEADTSLLTEPMNCCPLTRAASEQSVRHGVICTEAFLSSDFCGQAQLGPWCEYLSAIQHAVQEANKTMGL